MNEKKYMQELGFVPYHKMGFKILNENQMENMFPSYRNLLARISLHREKLEELEGDRKEIDPQFNLMYDNIFSVMGKRGSGKTSAVFTLKCRLENENEQKHDIVLPIVMPEIIPKECSMIGWVLSLLETTVKKLQEELKKKENENTGFFKNCMYGNKFTLLKDFEEVKELCYSQFYHERGAEEFSTAVVNTEKKTQNSFDFSEKLSRFWTSLVDCIRLAYGMDEKEEPLIYIIFDDVDLMPERVMDLFSTIIKYLSHPNLIVFVTADEELLYDVIENDMNMRLGKYSELRTYGDVGGIFEDYGTIYGLRQMIVEKAENKLRIINEMPKLYCDKVLPPSCRYYLESFDDCGKKAMFVERIIKGEGKFEPITLQSFFDEKVKDYLQDIFKMKYTRGQDVSEKAYENNMLEWAKNKNFLKHKEYFIKTYFLFCGNTSRQLANECLIIEELFENLKRINEKTESVEASLLLRELFNTVRYFAYDTLNAYGNMGMTTAELNAYVNKLLVFQPEDWGIYIDYFSLREEFKNRLESIQKIDYVDFIKRYIIVFILLFFIENILALEGKITVLSGKRRRNSVHGQKEFVEVLDLITAEGYSLVCRNNAGISEFLYRYEKVMDKPEILYDFDLKDFTKIRAYLDALPRKEVEEKNLNNYAQENPKWLKTMTKVLFIAHENIYMINNRLLPTFEMRKDIVIYDSFFELEMNRAQDQFIRCLTNDRLLIMKKASGGEYTSRIVNPIAMWNNLILKSRRKTLVESVDWNEIDNEKVSSLNEAYQIMENTMMKSRISDMSTFCTIYLLHKHEENSIFRKDYLRAFRTDNILDFLKSVCEYIKENIMEVYESFEKYKVLRVDEFEKAVEETYIGTIVKSQNVDRKHNTGEISRNAVNAVIKNIAAKLKRIEIRDDYYAGYMQAQSENLQYAMIKITSLLELKMENENKESAYKLVALHEILNYVQRIYLNAFLNNCMEDEKNQNATWRQPYRHLYDEIKGIVNSDEEENVYLKTILSQYIREGAEELHQALTKV